MIATDDDRRLLQALGHHGCSVLGQWLEGQRVQTLDNLWQARDADLMRQLQGKVRALTEIQDLVRVAP